MREKIFRFSAKVFGENYKTVFWFVGVLFLLMGIYLAINPPKVESDILSLLPQRDPVVQEFKSALEDFKSIDHLFILIEMGKEEESIEDYFDYVDEYVEKLKQSGMVSSVEYRIQDFEPAIKDLAPYAFLYLDVEELDKISKAFSKEEIEKSIAKDKASLSSPSSFLEKQLIRYDPLSLLPLLKGHFLGKTRRLNLDLTTGYYLSKKSEKPSLLIMARPVEPAQNIVFGKKLLKKLKEIENELAEEYPETHDLKFSYGGGYAINQSDSSLVVKDAIYNTTSSLVLVLLITFLAFRAKSALVYGWLPLLSALFVTLFVMKVFGGTINSATASIGALLIGLGIDFSTVLYGRFINERKSGESLENSIETTMVHTFKGVFVGAITTMATFSAMLATPFSGMRQIGILVSAGIFLVLLLNYVLFPPMLTFHYHYKKRKGKEQKLRVHTYLIEKIADFSSSYPVLTLIIISIATLFAMYYAKNISLDDSVQALRSPNNEGLLVTREINSRFGASFTYMMVTIEGSSPFEISAKAKKVADALEPLRGDGRILFTDSLSTYLPTEEKQKEIIAHIEKLKDEGFNYERIEKDFLEACNKNNFDPTYFKDFLDALKKMLNPEILTYERLSQSPLGGYLEKFMVKKGEEKFRGVVYVYISEAYKRSEPNGLIAAVKSVCPEAIVTGINRLSRTLRSEMKKSALKAFIIGTLLVLFIVYLDFKSFLFSLLSLSPLFLSIVFLLGSMSILKEPLNMMNIFVTTMIIGIGSDYGIHIVHRFLQPGGKNIERVINETLKPVIIAALTTMAGFGSLYFSSFPGLRSIGLVAFLGTLFSLLMCLTFLVAVLEIVIRRKKS